MEAPVIAGKRITSGKELHDRTEGARIEDRAALTAMASFLFSLRTSTPSNNNEKGSLFSAALLKRAYNTLLAAPSARLDAPALCTVPELLRNSETKDPTLSALEDDPLTAPWVRAYSIARTLVSHVESCKEVVQQTTRAEVVSFLAQKVTTPMPEEIIDAVEIDTSTSAVATIIWLPPDFFATYYNQPFTQGIANTRKKYILIEKDNPFREDTLLHEELHILTAPFAPARNPLKRFEAKCAVIEKEQDATKNPFPSTEDAFYVDALQHELLASFKSMYDNQFYAIYAKRDDRDAYDAALAAERYIDASETAGNLFEALLTAIGTFADNTSNATHKKSAYDLFSRLEKKFVRIMSALEHRAETIARIESPRERLALIENTITFLALVPPSTYPALFELPESKVRV